MTSEFKVDDLVYVSKPLSESSILHHKVYGVVAGVDSMHVYCNLDDGSFACFCHDGTHTSGNKRFRIFHYSEGTE